MGPTPKFRFLALTGAVLLAAGVFTPARAQDPDDLKRGVARISLMNGDVSVRRGDSGDWVAGVINAPLMTDDHVASAASSRGEVQFDAANMLRFGSNTELRLTQLESGRAQMELAHGIITYRILRPSDSNVEIDTPNVSVRPAKQGSYRISVNEAGETEVTARSGDVEIFTPTGSQWVRAGQTLMARGSASDPEFQVVTANPPDEWDRWSDGRDRTLLQSNSPRYVGPGITGSEDLDTYGNWTNVPEYGNVWQPAVANDWAPYQSGRWVWEDWYGWTWVSYDPWGWAPYHYGRWFVGAGGGWCWYPGTPFGRYNWSPAFVGFFGFGGHVGFGFGFGGLGWVPLAPFERFHPWWGRGFYGGFRNGGFARNTTIVNNANISNMYRNARVNGGVTGVNANQFGRGGAQHQTLSHAQIQQAGLVRGAVPVAPGRSSLQMSNRAATGNFPQSRAQNFASHTQAPQVNRVPFAQQQRGMQQLSRSDLSAPARSAAGNSGFSRSESGNSSLGSSRGGNIAPSRSSSSAPASGSSASGSHGWNRFGEPIHGTSGGTSQSLGTNRPSPNNGTTRVDNTRPSGSTSRGYSG